MSLSKTPRRFRDAAGLLPGGLTGKLVVSYVSIGFAIAVLTFFSAHHGRSEKESASAFHSEQLNRVSELRRRASTSFEESFAYVVSGDQEEKASCLGQLADFARSARDHEKLEAWSGAKDAEEKALFDAVMRAFEVASARASAFFLDFETHGNTKASFVAYEAAINDLNARLASLEAQGLSEAKQAHGDAVAASRWSDRMLLVTAVIALLLSITTAAVFGRNLGKRIRGLERAAKALGAGQFDVQLQDDSSDELGRMVRSFKKMAHQLKSLTVDRHRAQLRTTFHSTSQLLFVTSQEGRIVHANPAVCTLLGYEEVDLAGTTIATIFPSASEHSNDAHRVDEGDSQTWLRTRDGRRVPVRLTTSSLANDANDAHGLVFIAQDVSEREEMRARLLVADRMASLGTLCGGIAHEINNPLAYVMGNLAFIDASIGDGKERSDAERDEIKRALGESVGGATRIRDIVNDLRMFSRGDDQKRGPVNVQSVIESSVRIAWNEVSHRARLVKDLWPTSPAEANDSRLGQVVLNLLVNAAQAIEPGRADDNEIGVATRMEGNMVCIEVRDSGAGIPSEVRERVFDPFFSTKRDGEGTGLGLAICHNIVAGFGGSITVESEVGRGTMFRVLLPAAAAPPIETASAPVAAQGRRGRVLIVDDDALVSICMRRLIVGDHDVEVASGGDEAIERANAGEHFDVVLCDIMMPKTTGMDVYEALRVTRPDLADRMIFLTGGAFTPKATQFLEEVSNLCIEKPVDRRALRALLRERIQW